MIDYFDSRQHRLKPYFSEVEPYQQFMLQVSELHEIYVECTGNPKGKPIVYLHGGPGSGSDPRYRRFFDPKHYHIIQFDQRGAGHSKPFACTDDNTTWKLIEDMESIRKKLKLASWTVCGGSWGSTLALAYAITHPSKVDALILRGIFLLREKEINWFYQEGCSKIFPDAWQSFKNHIPPSERRNFLEAYHRRLNDEDPTVQKQAAEIWSYWEGSTSQIFPDSAFAQKYISKDFALAFARIESHYFKNKGFFSEEAYLLKQAHTLKHIPSYLVHGRYDVVCPVENAFELYEAMPHSKLCVVNDAGHTASEPGIRHKIIEFAQELLK